jgi:hypothetical protein
MSSVIIYVTVSGLLEISFSIISSMTACIVCSCICCCQQFVLMHVKYATIYVKEK